MMTRSDYAAYLDGLARIAREANVAEETFRKEVARRAEALRTERAFAWRRLNLLRGVGAAVEGVEEEEDALRAGRAVLVRETGLAGGSDRHRETVERFGSVVLAVWAAVRPAGPDERGSDDTARVAAELAAFETWYEDDRGAPFLALMEREIVELPLVEV